MNNSAFVFPGQGSQSIGMLSELAESQPLVKKNFSLVSDSLGYDLWQLAQEGPESRLNQTEHTQVAMLTADVAVFEVLKKMGVGQAKMMAGHSLGEYAALVAAEAISLSDAAQLVAKRGQLMQENIPLGLGAMAAIVGLTDEQVVELCLHASTEEEQVSPANYNAIGQVVIAGHTPAVDRAIGFAEQSGARMAKMLPVSVPCHCSLLKKAAETFGSYLAEAKFKTPLLPVISNVDLSIYKSAEQIRTLLKEQLYRPVRWVETIQLMKANAVNNIIECGPGKVLSGLVKRIERSIPALSVNDNASLHSVLSQLTVNEN